MYYVILFTAGEIYLTISKFTLQAQNLHLLIWEWLPIHNFIISSILWAYGFHEYFFNNKLTILILFIIIMININ